jgi:hypothetical protein
MMRQNFTHLLSMDYLINYSICSTFMCGRLELSTTLRAINDDDNKIDYVKNLQVHTRPQGQHRKQHTQNSKNTLQEPMGDTTTVLILIYTQFAYGLTCEFLVELN